MSAPETLGASFRDPNGFLFTHQGGLYRQVNQSYREHYTRLIASGLYDQLTQTGLLIPHEQVSAAPAHPDAAFCVLRPQRLEFISYPYEWSFSQLKDAALTTLEIQQHALAAGMTLKDASAYNIQFHNGHPLLVDTLSFEIYNEGEPWVAYRQFCQHFLAPLALMAYCDVRLSQLLRLFIDGVPLDLAAKLLPARTRFDFGLSTHIHLHASLQRRYADKVIDHHQGTRRMSRLAFVGLLDNLRNTVLKLRWKPTGTEWGDYYPSGASHYSSRAMAHKGEIVAGFLERIASSLSPRTVWDLGANTGVFSRLAGQQKLLAVSFDIDPAAVEQNYLACRAAQESQVLPLVIDLTNPSPALGWHHQERQALLERGPAGAALALALIHHLAIANNVPLPHLARFFGDLSRWLIIEFVPKQDPQVQKLLSTRLDIFPDYHQDGFEAAFGQVFILRESVAVADTSRLLYLMERK